MYRLVLAGVVISSALASGATLGLEDPQVDQSGGAAHPRQSSGHGLVGSLNGPADAPRGGMNNWAEADSSTRLYSTQPDTMLSKSYDVSLDLVAPQNRPSSSLGLYGSRNSLSLIPVTPGRFSDYRGQVAMVSVDELLYMTQAPQGIAGVIEGLIDSAEVSVVSLGAFSLLLARRERKVR